MNLTALIIIAMFSIFCALMVGQLIGRTARGIRLMANAASPDDPGTGKTFDYRKMVLGLLGLDDSAPVEAINEAYKAAMATDADDEVIKSKVANLQKANETVTAQLKEKEALMANEQKAKADAEKKATDAAASLVTAQGLFANERAAHIELIIANAVKDGKITGAEVEASKKLLANATDFAAEVKALNAKGGKLNTTSQIGQLGGKITAVSGASDEFANEVQKAMKENSKLDYNAAWIFVKKSEKGKALLAQMHQPQAA